MRIPSKFSGYQRDGIRLYPVDSGGGGGGGTPERQTTIQDLPAWAKPYAQQTLAGAQALAFQKDADGNITGFQPYQAYTGERISQFTPLQQQAFQGAGSMQTSPQLGQATGIMGTAAQQALGANYNPYQAQNQYQAPSAYSAGSFDNQFQNPGAYQSGQFGYERAGLPSALSMYQMGPAQQVRSDSFDSGDASRYMSPYIQQALDPQLREASRASEIQRNQSQAQAVASGAFGGSRQAIVEAERQRNLGTLQNDIMDKGYQTAFSQAQNQYNQDQARYMQGQMANQQAGLTVGQQNLNAALGVQQLGTQSGLQAALANQQAGLQAQQLGEQSRQFGAGQGMTAAQLQAQYGLSAQQAEEASRQYAANYAANTAASQAQYGQAAQQLQEQSNQFGATYGLQGLQAAMSGASQLGQLGNQQFLQGMDINKLQAQYGAQQQQQIQNLLSQQYQDYLNQQRYPYQQLEFLSGMVRGTPMGTVNTMYSTPTQPSTLQQLAGAGATAYGVSKMVKKGGVVKPDGKKQAGLADLALTKI